MKCAYFLQMCKSDEIVYKKCCFLMFYPIKYFVIVNQTNFSSICLY